MLKRRTASAGFFSQSGTIKNKIMTRVKTHQKIISFAENKSDLDKITQFIMDGWAIVKLMPHGNYFIGVMEKMNYDNNRSFALSKKYVNLARKSFS